MNAPTHFPVIEDGSAPTLPESYAADPEGILLGYQRRVLELLSPHKRF